MTDGQIPDKLGLHSSLDFADLHRGSARARLGLTGRVDREDSELIIAPFDQVHDGVFGVHDVVFVTLGPYRAAHLAFLNHITGNSAATIRYRRLPPEINVVLANLGDLWCARW